MRRPLWEHVGERALASGDPTAMRYTADVTWLLDQWGAADGVGFERLLEELGELAPARRTAYRWLTRAREVFADVPIEDVVAAVSAAHAARANEEPPAAPDWRYVTGLGGIEVDLPAPSRGRVARPATGARRAPARRDRRRQRLGT